MARFGRLRKGPQRVKGGRSRAFTMCRDQIPEMVDALFFGNTAAAILDRSETANLFVAS